MPGTKAGGESAAATNKERQGEDFYQLIGSIGGKAPCKPGAGFKDRDLAKRAGALGGKVSRRPPADGYVRPLPAIRTCTYCGATGHAAYSCELRQATIRRKDVRRAEKAVDREQQELDRQKNQSIASKWGNINRRPW